MRMIFILMLFFFAACKKSDQSETLNAQADPSCTATHPEILQALVPPGFELSAKRFEYKSLFKEGKTPKNLVLDQDFTGRRVLLVSAKNKALVKHLWENHQKLMVIKQELTDESLAKFVKFPLDHAELENLFYSGHKKVRNLSDLAELEYIVGGYRFPMKAQPKIPQSLGEDLDFSQKLFEVSIDDGYRFRTGGPESEYFLVPTKSKAVTGEDFLSVNGQSYFIVSKNFYEDANVNSPYLSFLDRIQKINPLAYEQEKPYILLKGIFPYPQRLVGDQAILPIDNSFDDQFRALVNSPSLIPRETKVGIDDGRKLTRKAIETIFVASDVGDILKYEGNSPSWLQAIFSACLAESVGVVWHREVTKCVI